MVRQARVKRCVDPLEPWEFWPFIEKLSLINKQSALIARLLWKLNRLLARSGSYVTLGEILQLRQCDIRMDKKMFDTFRITRRRHVRTAIELPDYIFFPIIRLIKPNSP